MTRLSDHRPTAAGTDAPTRPQETAEPSPPLRIELRTEEDLLAVRHAVRAATVAVGFGIVDQTRVITAASELARNAYIHGGGGALRIEYLHRVGAAGLRLTISDNGPGIAHVEEALTDGFTTGAGLGHGLGGARRLMDEFELHTAAGEGTTVSVTRWTRP
ncbi:anti-sigma regulatory factor [Streptomyces sp. NPDC002990]